MKQEKIFDFSVWIAVIVLHLAGLFVIGNIKPPEVTVGASVLEIVDLSGFQTAAPKPAPVVQPKPKIEPPKKEVLAVKKKDKKPDVVVKKQPPKVKEQPKPTPVKQEEVAEPQETPPAPQVAETKSEQTGSGTGTAGEGKETGAGGGENTGSGGGGGGNAPPTAASHIGGHLHNPKPPYPQRSIDNGEEGTVRLRVRVEPNGRPSRVDLAKSSGYPALDRSALKTVREQYRFTPATRMGQPVASDYTFGIKFELP